MTNLKTLLAETDTADLALSPAHTRLMRQVVVAAARNQPTRSPSWIMLRPMLMPTPLAVAGVLIVMLCAGAAAGRRFESRDERSSRLKAEATAQGTGTLRLTAEATGTGENERRQLHFASPGGTRIIWVFNPDLSLKETIP